MADGERLEPCRGEAHERARKIDPAYTEGELVRVAGGRNQAEAELIQNMLLEEGVPSMLRRSMGFDVPDFLAAGPRDVLVPASALEAARDLLVAADLAPTEGAGGESQLRKGLLIASAIVLGAGATAAIAWLLQSAG
jgi:hypothetical protein